MHSVLCLSLVAALYSCIEIINKLFLNDMATGSTIAWMLLLILSLAVFILSYQLSRERDKMGSLQQLACVGRYNTIRLILILYSLKFNGALLGEASNGGHNKSIIKNAEYHFTISAKSSKPSALHVENHFNFLIKPKQVITYLLDNSGIFENKVAFSYGNENKAVSIQDV